MSLSSAQGFAAKIDQTRVPGLLPSISFYHAMTVETNPVHDPPRSNLGQLLRASHAPTSSVPRFATEAEAALSLPWRACGRLDVRGWFVVAVPHTLTRRIAQCQLELNDVIRHRNLLDDVRGRSRHLHADAIHRHETIAESDPARASAGPSRR